MNWYKSFVAMAILALLAGCNSYRVKAIPHDDNFKTAVVINNPKVRVSDFEAVLEDAFAEHGIGVRVVSEEYIPTNDEYVVRYNALQSWDVVLYMTDATIRVQKGSRQIGRGRYHHNGTNMSLDIFTKWRGTSWKMRELYDELLKEYK